MFDGVIVTASWAVKPDRVDETVEMIRRMFLGTRLRKGFRNIRLHRSDIDPNTVVLIEEWDEAQNFHDYIQFRTDSGEMAVLMEMAAGPAQIGIWARSPLAEAH